MARARPHAGSAQPPPADISSPAQATFADVGKAVKDLFGGITLEHKTSVALKPGGAGLTLNAKADGLDAKLVQKVHGVSCEGTLTQAGKSTLTLTKDELVKGLKLQLTTSLLPKVTGAKGTATYVMTPPVGKSLTLKGEVGLNAAPKADLSAAYVNGAYTVGGEFDIDSTKGTVGKYTLGAQYVGKEDTVALLLADKLDTVKISAVRKVYSTTTAGVELVHKVTKADTTGTIGLSHKLEGGKSAKATVTSAGILSLFYTQDFKLDVHKSIPKNATATIAAQFNTYKLEAKPKYGVTLSLK